MEPWRSGAQRAVRCRATMDAARAARGFALLVALAACGDRGPALVVQRCQLFEDVNRQHPTGGVPVALSVPAAWRRTDATDGSCRFERGDGRGIRVSLEVCVKVTPCDAGMPSERTHTTDDVVAAGQVLRTSVVRAADRVTGKVVLCRASVQGASITSALDAELTALSAPCGTLVIDRAADAR